MCAEAAKGLEPFDRKVPRSLFLECGEAACRAQVMLDRGYTPTAGTTAQLTGGECAAVLLALLLQTEASVPPTKLEKRLPLGTNIRKNITYSYHALCVRMDIIMPKPAINVIAEVPP